MKIKKLLLGASVALLGVTLASCDESKPSTRNTETPYGSIQFTANGEDVVVATANNDLKLSMNLYYDRLRHSSYTTVTNAIDNAIFKNEIDALNAMYSAETLSALENKDNVLNVLSFIDDDEKLYEIDEVKYQELRTTLLEKINSSISSSVLGTSSAEAVAKKTEKEINDSINKFIIEQAKKNVIVTSSDISYILPANASYTLSNESDIVEFSSSTLAKLQGLVDNVILEQARLLSSKKALYKIADDETIMVDEEETKNDNYIFKDSNYKDFYESSYKTYGTYNAIIVQFNSYREALRYLEKIGGISEADPQASYIELYKEYYKYRNTSTINIDSEEFVYNISEDKNDFADINASVSSLITDTLENGEYLTEPRNINDKYVMAYRISSSYELDNNGEQVEYDEIEDVLGEAKKAEIETNIKEDILESYASGYKNTNYSDIIEASDIKIYDPFFEYKFEYSYSDIYEPIDKKDFNNNLIFSINDYEYSVDDFFKEASLANSSTIITDYFQLEYAYSFYNQYVEEYIIDSEAKENNEETLDKAISTFEADDNSTYPAEIGLDTYLLAAYGYSNKDDVLKYYYSAKTALTEYKAKILFDEWALEDKENESFVINKDTIGILNNLLQTGNKNISELFSINLDHILINIDDDADGSPDDPKDFLTKNPDVKEDFENALVELAQAIYKEAIADDYNKYSLFEILTHIKKNYEEGAALLSDPTKTWDDFKDFNFLLTVEKLAESSDITQDSVSNFVVPFADYVKGIYESTSNIENIEDEYENGIFYFYNTETKAGSLGEDASDASTITMDTLCETSFGYHMLVLNSYSGPETLKYTPSDDAAGAKDDLQIVIREYENDDEEDVTIYVVTDAYNETSATSATINQFFIYYVQQQNNDSSYLDSDTESVMSSLFDDVITVYTSSNFQTYLLLKSLDIKINNGYNINDNAATSQVDYYYNLVIDYDTESDYVEWLDGSMDWTRPDAK